MRETAAKNIPGTKMYRGYFSSCAYSEELASASIAASAAEDQEQDDPHTAVIAASASFAHSAIAASAAEDKQ